MQMLKFAGAIALATFTLAGPASAAVQTFDDPITLSPTQQAGAWYTDRYAPAGFESGVSFGGDDRLKQTISASDGQADGFYNTQGRKFDLGDGTLQLSIDLYVDDTWAGANKRMAGLWATAFDTLGDVSAYPILEFTSSDSNARFRGYDVNTGLWMDMGLPSAFAYDSWYTLGITLSAGQVTYTVGNLSASVAAVDSVDLGNVILQGYNTPAGAGSEIYWDNLNAAVPEPATWAMMILGFGLAGATMRRRRVALAAL
jgi:hypothetical protein